jgi:hypothetical protein
MESTIDSKIKLPLETYLVPQTIFVGDKGRLIVSLGSDFEEAKTGVFLSPSELPAIPDLVITRMELEKRNRNIRLVIDFIPYATGYFSFPQLMIPSGGAVPLILGGLEINVASILTPELMVLSDPAPALAVPGTGLFIDGGAGVILLFLITGVGLPFWVRRYLGPFREKLRRRKLFTSLEQKLKELLSGKNDPLRQKELFSLAAGEFREVLSFLTGINCRVLTPLEFLALPGSVPGSLGPDYLCGLFRRWDTLRFSGTPMARVEVLKILDELGSFLSGARNAEKGL